VGIEDVRKIGEKLFLKPFKSDKKAIIIDLSLGITIEAQNGMLKTLEEPPTSTIIILTAGNIEDFLPTILSRCKIFEIKEGQQALDVNFQKIVERILKSTEGERMEISQEYGKDRETALIFAESTIAAAEIMLREKDQNEMEEYSKLINTLNQAYGVLKISNVSPRLILENTLLKL
jgi:DNA polymerase III delta prime subunit